MFPSSPREVTGQSLVLWVSVLYTTSSTAKPGPRTPHHLDLMLPMAPQGFKQSHSPQQGSVWNMRNIFQGGTHHPPPLPCILLELCPVAMTASVLFPMSETTGHVGTWRWSGRSGACARPTVLVSSLTPRQHSVWVLLRTWPHRSIPGTNSLQASWPRRGLGGRQRPRPGGSPWQRVPLLPGTDLEPPRAGKDPDLRPEEMLERRGGSEGQREGGRGQSPGRQRQEKRVRTPQGSAQREAGPWLASTPTRQVPPPLPQGRRPPVQRRSPSEELSSVK